MSLESHFSYLASKGYTFQIFYSLYADIQMIHVFDSLGSLVYETDPFCDQAEDLGFFVKQVLEKELEKSLPEGNQKARERF